jgi:hypothetical protein
MKKLFEMDRTKDIELIGNKYTIKDLGGPGIDLQGKFTDIDSEGYYRFVITNDKPKYVEYMTRDPNTGEITQ